MKRAEKKLMRWAAQLDGAAAQAMAACARRGAQIAREIVPVDSGELRAGIAQHGAAVICTAPHAAMVEYGTSRMAARPFMLPMAREMKDEFVREMRVRLQEVFQ